MSWKYAEETLDRVSRTFALNIKVLGKKLRRPVLLAYLYMRMADTIEDDPDLSAEEKSDLLKKFSQAVNSCDADGFVSSLPQGWKTSEKSDCALCCNAALVIPLLREYNGDPIKKAVEEMCSGMAEFASRKFVIENEADLDRYCYFVAGLVGGMLTELWGHKELRKLAISFGLALQLVNIIKDIQEDSLRKVCFVPQELYRKHGINYAREFLIQKAKRHLQDAKDYIKSLPRYKHRIRLFCLWPSLMAAANLRVLSEGGNKITRDTVKKIIRRTTLFGWSNSWVEKEFSSLS
ncbi:MAG: phytoene/squalene synthase family protein [Fibromonadales bacterium]|nr:phytoene/squalene synthase family protein [Fibromonadales bacterium]